MTRIYTVTIVKTPYTKTESTQSLSALPDITKVMLQEFFDGDPKFGYMEVHFNYSDK